MPSKVQQLYYLCLQVLAWLLWLPFTGNLHHGRSWGELKRLRPWQAALLLVPLACYVGVATWLYLFFPPDLAVWAGSVYAIGLALAGTLFGFSLATAKVIDWSHVYTNP